MGADLVDFNMDSSKKKSSRGRWNACIGIAVVVATALFFLWKPSEAPVPVFSKAVAVLKGDSDVGGTVVFTQSSPAGPVTITGDLKGLSPGKKQGFHIHVSGDLSNGCLSAGAHFNPFDRNHGAPDDLERHVGDLGNVQGDDKGVATLKFEDKLISLNGPLSIIGRAVVLHAGTDDLGRGDNEESLKTGNAGARAACGVIALQESRNGDGGGRNNDRGGSDDKSTLSTKV